MARIILDIDGVMYDFDGQFYKWAEHEGYDTQEWPPPTKWKFYQDFSPPMSGNQFAKLCHAGVNQGFLFTEGDPYPGTAEAVKRLRDAGHTIHIVTARNFGMAGRGESATVRWLKLHGIEYDTLTFSSDKTVVRADYAIDDKPSNVDKLAAAGVKAFLMGRPWNMDALGRGRDGIDRPLVQDMGHFADVVFNHEVDKAPIKFEKFEKIVVDDLAEEHKTVLAKLASGATTVRPGDIFVGDEVRVVSETGGAKGQKLARLGSIDPGALLELAKVAGFGENKYARLNYMKGYDWSLSFDACQRHLMQFWNGEDRDPESDLPHLAHAAWHCLAMLAFFMRELGSDDRYTTAGAGE